MEENIKKERRSFFHYGALGDFQGDLNPLSTGSVLETCVMPVLMYGSENWILTSLLSRRDGKKNTHEAKILLQLGTPVDDWAGGNAL